jgi:hypothetical protein
MTIINGITVTSLSLLLFFPQAILAEDEHHAAGSHGPGNDQGAEIHLSAGLHRLLNDEMAAIENGMQELIPAISSGEWQTVASIAQNVSDSFIMKQKLTVAQKEELHQALPPLFIEMDQDFHASAAMLAHAARMKNADVVNFYFFKLASACVACHTRYAAQRFPGLVEKNKGEGHQH